MQEIKKVVGERLREAREEKGLTQKDVGDALNYSAMGISHFENGIREMKLSDLQKLSSVLGKDLSYFLSTGLTMFRADGTNPDKQIYKSIEAFDSYIQTRKK